MKFYLHKYLVCQNWHTWETHDPTWRNNQFEERKNSIWKRQIRERILNGNFNMIFMTLIGFFAQFFFHLFLEIGASFSHDYIQSSSGIKWNWNLPLLWSRTFPFHYSRAGFRSFLSFDKWFMWFLLTIQSTWLWSRRFIKHMWSSTWASGFKSERFFWFVSGVKTGDFPL